MRIKSKLLTFMGALTIASSSFAAFDTLSPNACPSVSAIKATGVSEALELFPNTFFAYQFSTYRTHYNWFFALGLFDKTTEEEAVAEGNNALSLLVGSPKPLFEDGYWICNYDIGDNLAAVAMYADIKIPPLKMKQFFHKLH